MNDLTSDTLARVRVSDPTVTIGEAKHSNRLATPAVGEMFERMPHICSPCFVKLVATEYLC